MKKGITSHTLHLLAALLIATPLSALAAPGWEAKVEPELLAESQEKSSFEFLVNFNEQADLSGAAAQKTREDKTRYVVNALKATAAASQPPVLALLRERGLQHRAYWVANAINVTGTRADLQAVAERAEVKSLHRVLQQAVPALAPKYPGVKATAKEGIGIEPSLSLVRAPEVWALGFKGQGVVVGDHDVGVQWDHPALKEKYRGWDGATASHDYNWFNAFIVDPFCTDRSVPCDSNGHGTHTTGTMVGDDGMGNQIGMAPDAKWMACRSLLDPIVGVGTVPTYLDCMEWTLAPYPTGNTAAADPAMAPDVVNNSWGCLEACAPPILKSVNDATYAAGIIQVVSAGNDGSTCSTLLFPLAVYESSFTVGATDNNDEMASFSSRGPVLSDLSMRIKPNVVAPGVGTYSATIDNGYSSLSGTSMAGPHVAGLVALVLSAEPRLIGRVAEVRSLIEQTSVKIKTDQVCGGTTQDDIPNNMFGYGRIDALAAVLARPQLVLSATSKDKQYSFDVSAPVAAKLDATNVLLTLTLPEGATLASSSETPLASEGSTVKFQHDKLAPGESWAVQIDLTPASGSTATLAVASIAEADQVSPVSASPAKSTAVLGSRFGGALGLSVLLLLVSGWLMRRR